MEEEGVTLEDIKRVALEDSVGTLLMIIEGSPPLRHLALAAQLHQHGMDLDDAAKRLRAVAEEPEHREMADAMRTAARAAQIAFEAAANAVWQLYWITNHCTCEDCVQGKRRENAGQN